MLTIQGEARGGFCDGVNRRDFLRIGGLALGGMGLPQILRAENQAGITSSHKAVIMVFLAGGPPHQDMFDMKPDAPEGIRGEFKPIPTNVPGIEICEHMPLLASRMDQVAILRTIVGAEGEHAAVQCHTGFSDRLSRLSGGRPSLGAVVSKVQGPLRSDVPPFVGLSPRTKHAPWGDPGYPGYLGLKNGPFTPNGSDLEAMQLTGISRDRLGDRRSLLSSLDQFRRQVDSGSIDGMDSFTQRAFEILTSSRLAEALDLSREDPRLRERYGIGDMKDIDDGPPCCMDHFLMARRLVEAGVRCVTLSFGRWDYHNNNFGQCRERLPKLDSALSTLLDDLKSRGLEKDVTVIVWGEFGRTPKVNKDGGRDHWPAVSCALMAGGGMRTGQVVGETTRYAEAPRVRPISFQDVFATLYHNLGISAETALPDQTGRPMPLLTSGEVISELI